MDLPAHHALVSQLPCELLHQFQPVNDVQDRAAELEAPTVDVGDQDALPEARRPHAHRRPLLGRYSEAGKGAELVRAESEGHFDLTISARRRLFSFVHRRQ